MIGSVPVTHKQLPETIRELLSDALPLEYTGMTRGNGHLGAIYMRGTIPADISARLVAAGIRHPQPDLHVWLHDDHRPPPSRPALDLE